jgi:5-methylcytosine-specific restriction endonuclease McrA
MSKKVHIRSSTYSRDRDERLFARAFKIDDWSARGNKCCYCLERIPLEAVTADHAIPLWSGGLTKRENIRAACARCNRAKGPLTEKQFRSILSSPDVPKALHHITAWARFRLERERQRSLRRLYKYIGLSYN